MYVGEQNSRKMTRVSDLRSTFVRRTKYMGEGIGSNGEIMVVISSCTMEIFENHRLEIQASEGNTMVGRRGRSLTIVLLRFG